MTTIIPNFHLLMPGFNKPRFQACGTGIAKIGENDTDFSDFIGTIDSSRITGRPQKTTKKLPTT